MPLRTHPIPAPLPGILLLTLLTAGCAPDGGGEDAPGRAAPGPTADDVAAALRPAVQIAGAPPTTFALEDRLAHYQVPGVSVAVMDGGEIAWARGWGVADVETGAPVEPTTLFQAASISKPVAALTAMALVEEGALALDEPVNNRLTSWTVPDNDFTADSAVTLRGLLTHTAGLSVWGFPGYRKDRPFRPTSPGAAGGPAIPTSVQVLEGEGNTDPVRVFKVPGISSRYSGGGYTVMEQLVEDVTGQPFHQVARERVLEPAGMVLSTYEQPLPVDRWPEAARGHRADGSEVEGEWHSYPEQAAAGLWTTPTELLTLARHLTGILRGRIVDGVVSARTLETVLTPHRAGEEGFDSYGLGFSITGDAPDRPGPDATFGHGGSNEGFKAQWLVYRDRGQGVAVMTNGDQGSALAWEIVRAVSDVYGWPGFKPRVRAAQPLPPEALAGFAGRYTQGGDGVTARISVGDGVLEGTVPGRAPFTLHADAEAADTFFDPVDGQEVVFERDEAGAVTALVADGWLRLVRMEG